MSIKKEQYSTGELLKKIIQSEISKIHTSIPAEITKINLSKKTVEVRPLIRDKNLKEEFEAMPVIPNVPIRFYQTSTAILSIPLSVGDTGTLVFSERSIGNWQQEGKIQNPEYDNKFNLKDCYFCADLMPNGQGKALSSDLQIILNNASIKIKANGEIKLENSGGSITIDVAGSVTIEHTKIELGTGATEKAVLGDTLQTLLNAFIGLYNNHTHIANGQPPSSTATPLTGTELSDKVVVK